MPQSATTKSENRPIGATAFHQRVASPARSGALPAARARPSVASAPLPAPARRAMVASVMAAGSGNPAYQAMVRGVSSGAPTAVRRAPTASTRCARRAASTPRQAADQGAGRVGCGTEHADP